MDGKQEPSLGDQVWYAETVTSTQTMLDRLVRRQIPCHAVLTHPEILYF